MTAAEITPEPTELEQAVAAACTAQSALEQLGHAFPFDPRCNAARRYVDELLDELTQALPPVDELAAARETGEGLAVAAEQAAAFDRRPLCACGGLELDELGDDLEARLVDGLIHDGIVCTRAPRS